MIKKLLLAATLGLGMSVAAVPAQPGIAGGRGGRGLAGRQQQRAGEGQCLGHGGILRQLSWGYSGFRSPPTWL